MGLEFVIVKGVEVDRVELLLLGVFVRRGELGCKLACGFKLYLGLGFGLFFGSAVRSAIVLSDFFGIILGIIILGRNIFHIISAVGIVEMLAFRNLI